jgi:hypothetical protein
MNPTTDDRAARRRELARQARAFFGGSLGRSAILEALTPADESDPALSELIGLIRNQPKKSRFSGLWGKAYDAYIEKAMSLIRIAEQ